MLLLLLLLLLLLSLISLSLSSPSLLLLLSFCQPVANSFRAEGDVRSGIPLSSSTCSLGLNCLHYFPRQASCLYWSEGGGEREERERRGEGKGEERGGREGKGEERGGRGEGWEG